MVNESGLPKPWTRPSHVYVYDDPDTEGLNVDDVARYLADVLPGAEVRVRGDYLTHQLRRYAEAGGEELVAELTQHFKRAQVDDLVHPADRNVMPPESPADLGLGEVYRGQALQAILGLMVNAEESGLSQLHLVLTSMVFGDWDDASRQFRIRVACLGQPSLISTMGLIEGPARPRDFEVLRTQMAVMGMGEDIADLAEAFEPRALGYGDRRINECLKGYALMAVMYRAYGEGPCANPACRLHDAATQEELLACQCSEDAALCDRHKARLLALRTPVGGGGHEETRA
jgi:hypothetical protein